MKQQEISQKRSLLYLLLLLDELFPNLLKVEDLRRLLMLSCLGHLEVLPRFDHLTCVLLT